MNNSNSVPGGNTNIREKATIIAAMHNHSTASGYHVVIQRRIRYNTFHSTGRTLFGPLINHVST